VKDNSRDRSRYSDENKDEAVESIQLLADIDIYIETGIPQTLLDKQRI
jgi:hypothetical protein